MQNIDLGAVATVVAAVLQGHRKATKILSTGMVVKASGRHRPRKRQRTAEVLLTVGAPNHAERAIIAKIKKEKGAFPAAGLVTKQWPAKRRKAA